MKFQSQLLLVLTLLALSCGQRGLQYEKSKSSIVVTDSRGKEIQLEKPAERIVCLIESALSGLYMLNGEKKIVGISTSVYNGDAAQQYAALDDRIRNKTLVAPGNWDFVSIEKVLSLKPDLVIMWASQTESIEAIEAQGIQVYAVMLNSFQDVFDEIADLGILTASSKRADSLIQLTKAKLEAIKMNNKSGKKPSVYFMWAQGPLETSGQHSTVNELIEAAGGTNACMLADEHVVVNTEKVIDWNPDVIVMWHNAKMDPEDMLNLPGWHEINAIKNNKVFELPSVFFCDLWTLKFVHAVELVSAWCNPEREKDATLVQHRQELMIKLYGSKGSTIPE